MKGGRAYAELIKQLSAKGDITFLKGIEAYELVKKQAVLLTAGWHEQKRQTYW